jgi:hypothetical protein
METQLQHLLSKHSVMVSFRITKYTNCDSIKVLTEKIKTEAKNKVDFNNKLKEAIETETKNTILSGNIPGLIVNGAQQPKIETPSKNTSSITGSLGSDKLKIAELYMAALTFNSDVLRKNYTTTDICFILYHILNFLDINEKDFKKFVEDLNKGDTPGETKNE